MAINKSGETKELLRDVKGVVNALEDPLSQAKEIQRDIKEVAVPRASQSMEDDINRAWKADSLTERQAEQLSNKVRDANTMLNHEVAKLLHDYKEQLKRVKAARDKLTSAIG